MLSLYLLLLDAGQQAKFEKLYHQYRQLMYHIAYGILRDAVLAEDAVQQAFFQIISDMDKISQPVCPKTKNYAVIIVRNAAIDLYRKRQKQPWVSMEQAQESGWEPEGENPIEGQIQKQALTQAVARLSEPLRETLCLRYLEGYTTQETAARLRISEAAAAKRLARAKKELLRLLKEGEE